jgi:methylmalonyl-CoA/ethylmalonyl-CoA epimerase
VIRGIDHLGIAVRSIEEGRRLYEAMGLHVEAIEEVPQEKVRVALIPCGGSRIELLEPTAPDSPIAKFLDKRGPGLHHLCLASDALPADDARLREQGFEVLRERPSRGAGGCWVQFVHPRSAGGVLLELSMEGDGAEGHGEPAESAGEERAG